MVTGVSAPDASPQLSCGEAPLYLPHLRRPIGWRELDDVTLVARAHALLAERLAPASVNAEAGRFTFAEPEDPDVIGRESSWRGQLAPSDADFRQALASMRVPENDVDDPSADGAEPERSQNGKRFPGWLLTATLVLAALQLLMLLVAVKPLEVIQAVRHSVQEWKTQAQNQATSESKGLSGAKDDSVAVSVQLDPAHWWQSRQQTAPRSGSMESSPSP